MNDAVKAWLLAEVGTATPLTDLEARFTRLGTARAVALEIVRERLAALRAQSATVNVSSVVSLSNVENIRAYERQLARLEAGIPVAPDETDPDGDGTAQDSSLQVITLSARPRR